MNEQISDGSIASVDIDARIEAETLPSLDVTVDATPEPSGFARFGFAPELLEALVAIGCEQPSPIQSAAIP
ncbi:MAG: ATP-dependent helicase, partial [Cyanobacteria bacterium K_DeepCast_35m_m2_023]|nr:ATP-dependent helicase [Cyanobacteria bacterium K_DeepCast_35m_m2_023]